MFDYFFSIKFYMKRFSCVTHSIIISIPETDKEFHEGKYHSDIEKYLDQILAINTIHYRLLCKIAALKNLDRFDHYPDNHIVDMHGLLNMVYKIEAC